ncbi:MAG TPA: hypothetical protein VHE14_02470 [Solirubrobacteraceae bacterium]|nr:hypothetical protein [Solirubrobacteraceae bacterium]
MASTKLSISVDSELVDEAKRLAGDNLSRWIGDAIERKVVLEHARHYLAERDHERGPLDPELLEQARRLWATSSSTAAR